MENKIDWLEKHSDATMLLFKIVSEIEFLAKSFRTTGNINMYKSLTVIAGDIRNANEDIRDAIGESIKETIDRSGKSSKAILMAALAGVMIATEPTNYSVNPDIEVMDNKSH